DFRTAEFERHRDRTDPDESAEIRSGTQSRRCAWISSPMTRSDADTSTGESVFTVIDYWDGPRSGIANFNRAPHLYRSIFSDADDNWTDAFELYPVDGETLRLALEAWDIWLRWDNAIREGRTAVETHPALPEDRQRHAELKAELDRRTAEIIKTPPTHAKG